MQYIALAILVLGAILISVSPSVMKWASRRPINGEYKHVARLDKHCKEFAKARSLVL